MSIAQQKIKQAIENCNTEEFSFKEINFCGEDAVLVNPALQGTSWNQENKYLRSVIYRKSDYKVLSSGLMKFTNYLENPEHFPPPQDLEDSWVIDKIDGSLLILSFVNGQLNMRTRGTASYVTLENNKDFEIALEKYPLIEPWIKNHSNLSLLFEIVTPNQKIVLDYPEIDLFLIGAMNKETLELENQITLNSYAMEMCVSRPKTYHFDNLSELIYTIKNAKGIEGCCLYKKGGIWKIKSDFYLKLHSFKSNATPKNILELYAYQNYPKFDDFKNYIINNFDFECWKMVDGLVTQVCVFKKEVDLDIKDAQKFVDANKSLTDKEFALRVLDKDWKSIAFSLRKGEELPDRLIKNKIKEKL